MGLVVLLALAGLAMLRFGESAATARQRERETQLLWVGQQYMQALESYYRATPGPLKHLPVTMEELVRDTRFPNPVRHLQALPRPAAARGALGRRQARQPDHRCLQPV
jgi:type II secretory pathway pseudopilin PulG